MSMSLEKEVEELLTQGVKKKDIFRKLGTGDDKAKSKVLFYVNNMTTPEKKNTYQYLNFFLAILLGFITANKLITVFVAFQMTGFMLTLLNLIVPAVNIHVMREVLRFRRLGYQFLVVISILSMLQPENHAPREMTIFVILACGAAFLYLKIYPSKALLQQEIEKV
jgi:uncharacterized membrane protein YhaH (DUF805 family)